MLTQLRIKNLILSDEININFDKGFNALTGETGAGKSIIVGALDYIFGKPLKIDLKYEKDKPVILEADFNLNNQNEDNTKNTLEEMDLNHDINHIITISREISLKNRSISYVNGKRINQKQLGILRSFLVDFHSQKDQFQIYDNQYQLQVLDTWAILNTVRQECADRLIELKKLMDKKNRLEEEERISAEKHLLYEYQIAELENLDLDVEEEQNINFELDILTHAEELFQLCNEMQQSFVEQDNSIIDIVSLYKQRLQRFENNTINNISSYLNNLVEQINNIQRESRILSDSISFDETRMSLLEERMKEILRIKRKYKMARSSILSNSSYQ